MSQAPSTRRWFQFGVGTILAMVTVVALWLGLYVSPAKREERAVQALRQAGMTVCFDYQKKSQNEYSVQADIPGPRVARWLLGDDFFQTAEWVRHTRGILTVDELRPVSALRHLRRLTLPEAGIDDDQMLGICGPLKLLEQIDLKNNNISDRGLASLEGMSNLQVLSLSGNKIAGSGLRHLSDPNNLEQLFLHDNPLTDEGLLHLADSGNLRMLGLANTAITDTGARHLAKLDRLTYLGLTGTGVSQAAVNDLKVKLLNCEIESP